MSRSNRRFETKQRSISFSMEGRIVAVARGRRRPEAEVVDREHLGHVVKLRCLRSNAPIPDLGSSRPRSTSMISPRKAHFSRRQVPDAAGGSRAPAMTDAGMLTAASAATAGQQRRPDRTRRARATNLDGTITVPGARRDAAGPRCRIQDASARNDASAPQTESNFSSSFGWTRSCSQYSRSASPGRFGFVLPGLGLRSLDARVRQLDGSCALLPADMNLLWKILRRGTASLSGSSIASPCRGSRSARFPTAAPFVAAAEQQLDRPACWPR